KDGYSSFFERLGSDCIEAADSAPEERAVSDEQTQQFETIRYEVRDRAGWLTLHRPEARNAISEQMMDEITAALELARKDDDVRALVIAGAGSNFSAGYEIADDWGWFDDEKPTQT